jgi:CRP-like cAMP-binding protein
MIPKDADFSDRIMRQGGKSADASVASASAPVSRAADGIERVNLMPGSTETASTRPRLSKRAILSEHPFFKGLAPELIDQLSSHAITRVVNAGTIIYAKGDPGNSLFAVVAGTVRISVPSLDGKDTVFNLLNEGEIFGEIALLDGRPRSAEVTAVTDCELMMINRRDFVPLMKNNPEIALKLIDILCARLRRTSEQVEDVMFLDLPARLAKILLRLAENAPASPQGRKIAMTQREVGQIIGMSRESTNKQLRLWEQRNWVRLERGSIVVVALDEITDVATSGAEAEKV